MKRAWLEQLVPALAAVALTGLLAVQPTGILNSYDVARMHEPYREMFRAALLAGEWPWWNPFTALGRPYFADIETAMLYPPTWLALPFGVRWGIILTVWLHFALVIEGTRRLARHVGIAPGMALAAGVSFAASGALLARMQAGQLQFFCVVCLWPWIWLSALRLQDAPGMRTMLGAALCFAVSFLAGSPQILWCGLVPLLPLLLARATSLRTAGASSAWLLAAGTVALALVAVQLVPFIELIGQGNRPLNDTHFAARHGQTGIAWLSLVVPPGPWLNLNWEFNLHAGALVALGAAAAVLAVKRNRDVRALIAVTVVSFLLALGDITPILPALADWVPGFSSIRYPSRYGLAGVLAITLLGCWWLSQPGQLNAPWRRVLVVLHFALLGLGAFQQGMLYEPKATPRYEDTIRADLAAGAIASDSAPPRVMLPQSLLRPNAGGEAGVSTVVGFNNPALVRTWSGVYHLAGQPLPDFHRTDVNDEILAQLFPRRDFFSVAMAARPPQNEVVLEKPAPRAFVAFRTQTVGGYDEALRKIRAGHDYRGMPLVESSLLQDAELAEVAAQPAAITRFSRNGLEVNYESSSPGLLVLAEPWYPGWRGAIDGQPAAVEPVNAWMRGVVIPTGRHAVTFSYQPRWIIPAAAISLLTAIILAVLWRRFNGSSQTGT